MILDALIYGLLVGLPLAGSGGYAIGRIHGGWGYRRGWRGGWRAGWAEGDRHARRQIVRAYKRHNSYDPSGEPTTRDLGRYLGRLANDGAKHRRVVPRNY